MVGLAQLPSKQSRRSQRLPLSHKAPLHLSKKLIPNHRPNPGRHASQSVIHTSTPPTATSPSHLYSDIYVGLLVRRQLDSRRVRHRLTFRRVLGHARSPRRALRAARASCVLRSVPKSKLMAGPDDYRAIDYPVFCSPAETPVTVERIRLMYSAFFSSAISSWFIRTSRRARTWAMDRAST